MGHVDLFGWFRWHFWSFKKSSKVLCSGTPFASAILHIVMLKGNNICRNKTCLIYNLKVNFFRRNVFIKRVFTFTKWISTFFAFSWIYFQNLFFCKSWSFLVIIHTTIKIYLEISPKTGKKLGIHFYENILSEMNLPLPPAKRNCWQRSWEIQTLIIFC